MGSAQGASATPDWAALYLKHRQAMYRVAAATLRAAGLADRADDVVQAAMVSLMSSPPQGILSWEALMVATVRRRARDLITSADVRHAGPELGPEHEQEVPEDTAEVVVAAIERQRLIGVLHEVLAVLEPRLRKVAWEYLALGRPRPEIARELGVTAPRVSQMAREVTKKLKDEMERRGESM